MTKELTITRVFNAPRELVWKAWTDPEMIMKWHGPRGFTSPSCEIDLRVGGKYLFCMESASGMKIYSGGVIEEMDPPKKLVCTDYFADEKGNKVSPTKFGMGPEFPEKNRVTVLFEEEGGNTKIQLIYEDITGIDDVMLADMQKGWGETLDKLRDVVEGQES